MKHSKLENRLEELRTAQEGVDVAEAHLRYWQIQATEAEHRRRLEAQTAIIAAAQREIVAIQRDWSTAASRVAQCEARVAETRKHLVMLRNDRQLQRLLRAYQALLDGHDCAEHAVPFTYENGALGAGLICSICHRTVAS